MNDSSQGNLSQRDIERFQAYFSNQEHRHRNFYPGLSSNAWHDPSKFSFVQTLEAGAAEIRGEFESLPEVLPQLEPENIHRTGTWRVFFLARRGRIQEEAFKRCPLTVGILLSHPSLRSRAGAVYFSSLDTGTHISPHYGPTNTRLRCHLGLDIPERCGLRVGDIERTWTEGQVIVFDDSFKHEAWNFGDRPRTVLVVDVWHPDLSDGEVFLLEDFLSRV